MLQILKLSAVLVYDGPEIRQKSLKQTVIFSCRLLALTEHIYFVNVNVNVNVAIERTNIHVLFT